MLIFVDESGDPHPADSNLRSTLLAVCIPEVWSHDFNGRLHAAIKAVYPTKSPYEVEVKADRFLARSRYEHTAQRRELIRGISEIIETCPIGVFSIQMARPAAVPNWPALRLTPPYRLLIERVELYMRRTEPNGLAKMIFDERNLGVDAAISRCFRSFIHATGEGRSWRHILDVPFFVASAITPGIQVADLLAGATRLYLDLRDQGSPFATEWELAVLRLQEAARAKSMNFTVNHETYYGMYFMPDRYFAHPPGSRALP